jgi:hypothetical protein
LKVVKEQKGSGYIITVLIGNHGQNSYWTSPPMYGKDNHHYNFEVEYLRGRYSIINTKNRAEQFSSLYKNLWVEVTPYQSRLIHHCVGIDRNKKPYRNYFFTQETDKDWNELVEKGLAIKGTKHPNNDEFIYFYLSKQGLEFVLGKSVSDKVYKEL